MVTEYKPVRKEDLNLDDTKRLVTNVEILQGITGLVKKTQLPASLTASGNLRVAIVEDTVWGLALGTFWSGAVVVNPGDNVGVIVTPYTRSTLYIRSHSGTMSFRASLHDGYEYRTMEEKSFSGDMIWTIDHVTPRINLMSLSSGTVTARLYTAKW